MIDYILCKNLTFIGNFELSIIFSNSTSLYKLDLRSFQNNYLDTYNIFPERNKP